MQMMLLQGYSGSNCDLFHISVLCALIFSHVCTVAIFHAPFSILLVEASCQKEATQVSKAATEASKLPTWYDWCSDHMGAMNIIVL